MLSAVGDFPVDSEEPVVTSLISRSADDATVLQLDAQVRQPASIAASQFSQRTVLSYFSFIEFIYFGTCILCRAALWLKHSGTC
jgi:hypothetical protein